MTHRIRLAVPTLLLALAAVPRPAAAQLAELPPLRLAEVLDSAAVVEALRQAPPPPGGTRPLFRVAVDSAGAETTVELVNLADASYGRAVAAVLSARARAVPAWSGRGMFVRAEGGPGATLVAVEGEMVRPEMLDRARMVRDLSRALSSRAAQTEAPLGQRSAQRPMIPLAASTQVKARVRPDGSVDQAQFTHRTGDPDAEAAILRVVRRVRFRPATLNGEPVTTWVVFPIGMTER